MFYVVCLIKYLVTNFSDTSLNSLVITTVIVASTVCPCQLTVKAIIQLDSIIAYERQQTSYLAGIL